MAQVPDQQGTGVRHRRVRAGGSLRFADRRYYEGSKLIYAAKVRNGFVPQLRREVAQRFKGLQIDICPFANLPEKKRTMWALTKEEMENCRWLKAGAGRPDRVCRMDAGRASEAFEICRTER
jgi:hypothetical protein